MGFVKRGDAEIIKIIEESKPDDKETAQALSAIKQDAKNVGEDGNKTEFSRESDKL